MISETIKQVEELMPLQDFTEEIREYDISEEYQGYLKQDGGYYRGLASLCQLFKFKNVLEIGTNNGASAIVMSKHCDNVDTYDVKIKEDMFLSNNTGNIKFNILKNPEDCLMLDFNKYDFIFVDIDHSGDMEIKIHNQIILSGYKGLVAYDDTGINDGMKFFWDNISQEKINLNWNRFGFGIVNYND